MDYFKKNWKYILLIYFNYIFIYSLFRSCYSIVGSQYVFLTFLFIISVFVYWIITDVIFSPKKKFYTILSTIIIIILFGIIFKDQVYRFFSKDIVSNMIEVNNLVANNMITEFEKYKASMTLGFPVLIIIYMILMDKNHLDLIVWLNLIFVMFFYFIGYEEIIRFKVFRIIFINILLLAFNGHKGSLKRFEIYNIKNNLKEDSLIFKAMLYALVIAVFTSLFAVDKQGIWGNEIDSKMTSILRSDGDVISSFATKKQFNLSESGYNDSQKMLGGAININRNRVMLATGQCENLYLKGNIKERYTGYSWENIDKDYRELKDNNNKEKLAYMSINPVGIKSSTLFSPSNTKSIKIKKGKVYASKEDNVFIAKEIQDTTYDINYAKEVFYGNFINVKVDDEEFNRIYLQLPETVTYRTRELVESIIKDKNSAYDKVLALKDYLGKNYVYATDVKLPPEGQDFVDQFLFEDKKGYCVHFGTALTVMCRMAGIPARYVEGFKTGEKKKGSENLEITNEDAHAWTEILQNKNEEKWMVVDATATPGERRRALGEEPQGSNSNAGDNQVDPNKKENNKKVEEPTKEDNENQMVKRNYSRKFVLISLGSALVLYIIFRFLKSRQIRRTLKKKCSAIEIYYYSLRRLKNMGIMKDNNETDLEFAKRIEEEKLRDIMVYIVEKAYDEYYGENSSQIDGKKIIEFLDGYLKAKLKRTTYLNDRYFGK